MRLIIALFILTTTSVFGYNSFREVTTLDVSIIIDRIEQTQETCNLNNGTLYIHILGDTTGLLYSIDAGITFQSSPFFEDLDSKDYLLIVSDPFGNCTEIKSVQIADAPIPTITMQGDCIAGENKVFIIPTIDGGIGPFMYNWEGDDGSIYTSETLNTVPPGNYALTITDRLGCYAMAALEVLDCCKLEGNCNIPPVVVSCINEVPAVKPQLLNSSTSSAQLEIELLQEGIGFSEVPCGDISLEVKDSNNNPSDCTQDYIITREYNVTDDFNSFVCSHEITVTNFMDAQSTDDAKDREVSCNDDISIAFSSWVADRGGMLLDGCSEPYTISTLPLNPDGDLTCGESLEVTFVVEDACGNKISSAATFSVYDDVDPTIVCPTDLTIDPLDGQLDSQIDTWLASAEAFDNCAQDLMAINDLDRAQISLDCDDPAQIDVMFNTVDDCNNIFSCSSVIYITAPTAPQLLCGENLEIDCDSDRLVLTNTWLEEFTASSGAGTTIAVDNTFDQSILDGLLCNEEMDVAFNILDDCGRVIDCQRSISIVDKEMPNLFCPPSLVLGSALGSGTDTVTNWLSNVLASDNCTLLLDIENNLTRDFSDLCNIEDVTTVQFDVADACGNINSCSSDISVTQTDPSLSCPAPIVIECGTDFNQDIEAWLASAAATDNNDNMIINDFTSINLNGSCSITEEIEFKTEDNCTKEVSCKSQITLEDSVAPDIQCPEVITIDLQIEDDKADAIRTWLSSVSAEDCTKVSFSNDLDPKILDVYCTESHIVEFQAEDICGKVSDCTTEVNFINESNIEIKCPEEVFFRCTDPYLDNLIDNHLGLAEITSNIAYSVDHTFSVPLEELHCNSSQLLEIETVVTDYCENTASCYSYIEVVPDPKIYVPNVIAPHEFSDNFFTVFGNETVLYIANMIIYNRWGNIVFEGDNLDINEESQGWDGRYEDRQEDDNVFTYQVEVMDRFGEITKEAGTLQVLGK